jgi:DNA-binding NtrC family response regulator
MADGDFIDVVHLREVLHSGLQAGSRKHTDPRGTLREMEKVYILNALQQTRGNKAAAAAVLGISLRGLHYKLKRLKGKSTEAAET